MSNLKTKIQPRLKQVDGFTRCQRDVDRLFAMRGVFSVILQHFGGFSEFIEIDKSTVHVKDSIDIYIAMNPILRNRFIQQLCEPWRMVTKLLSIRSCQIVIFKVALPPVEFASNYATSQIEDSYKTQKSQNQVRHETLKRNTDFNMTASVCKILISSQQ